MTKQPGDGRPNVTREEQRANKTDQEAANDDTAKSEGLPGLNTIADRNTQQFTACHWLSTYWWNGQVMGLNYGIECI